MALLARVVATGLAVCVLAACGGTSDPVDATGETDPAVTESPALQATPTPTPSSSAEPAPDDSQAPSETHIEVVIEGEEIFPNAVELAMDVGETLVLRITSDRAGEFHVHARPESYVQFETGESRHTLTFENPGTVEIEEHDTGFAIAVIEVR